MTTVKNPQPRHRPARKQLQPGTAVQVRFGPRLWPATIIERQNDGRYRVAIIAPDAEADPIYSSYTADEIHDADS